MKRVSEIRAKEIIEATNDVAEHQDDAIGNVIDTILWGSHKTYKYVLVTALLAKATNEEIDPLSLQAKDASEGAYDARSICHHVLVPFERDFLPNSLGGSNEPFLNKPARYPRLTTDNAVRRGRDMETLTLLISVLSSISSSELAQQYLSSALYTMKSISESIAGQFALPDMDMELCGPQIILDFTCELVSNSFEGETCPLVVAAIEHLYYDGSRIVVPHKVNESGASSKEVGDIDIYDNDGNIISSIEVKDKDFSKNDVEHAILKFAKAELRNTLFVYGVSVAFDKSEVFNSAAEYGRNGYFCSIISIIDFVKARLNSLSDTIELQEFVSLLLYYAQQINAKEDTIKWIKDLAVEYSL